MSEQSKPQEWEVKLKRWFKISWITLRFGQIYKSSISIGYWALSLFDARCYFELHSLAEVRPWDARDATLWSVLKIVDLVYQDEVCHCLLVFVKTSRSTWRESTLLCDANPIVANGSEIIINILTSIDKPAETDPFRSDWWIVPCYTKLLSSRNRLVGVWLWPLQLSYASSVYLRRGTKKER